MPLVSKVRKHYSHKTTLGYQKYDSRDKHPPIKGAYSSKYVGFGLESFTKDQHYLRVLGPVWQPYYVSNTVKRYG